MAGRLLAGTTISPSKDVLGMKDTEEDMWASVCDLLHTTPSPPPPPSSSDDGLAPKPKRVRVYTNKAEVQQLEAEIKELQAQLVEAKRFAASKVDVCPWERAAAQQRVEKNKSLEENEQLHAAIRERGDYIERVQKLITKTPRWNTLPDVTTAAASTELDAPLPADPARRHAVIHALADQLYKRYQNILIQARAFDLRDDMYRGEPITLPHQEIGFQAVNHVNLPAPFQRMAAACWDVLSGVEAIPTSNFASDIDVWERVDPYTVYERFQTTQHGKTCHSNILRKWYEMDDRVVIVWRTIVDDALVTRKPSDTVDDSCGWWTFAVNPEDPAKSHMTIVVQSNISRLVESHDEPTDPEDVIAALKKLVVNHPAPPDENSPSFLMSFIERGRRLRPVLRRAIERAIREHSESSPRQSFQVDMVYIHGNEFNITLKHVIRQRRRGTPATQIQSYMDELTVNVLEDLPFLIATDEALEDEFAFVCELLDDSSRAVGDDDDSRASATDSPSSDNINGSPHDATSTALEEPPQLPSSKRKGEIVYPEVGAKNRFQYRQKEEMKALRAQVDHLKATLTRLNPSLAPTTAQKRSVWEKAAKEERRECKRALEENDHLRDAVHQQMTFVQHMQRLLVKKRPKLTTKEEHTAEWESYKLAAQQSLRVAAIHAIADRQVRRMQSALIRAGLFHTTDEIYHATPRVQPDRTILIDFVNHVTCPAPFDVVGAACWQVLSNTHDPSLPVDATQTVETIDPWTVYQHFSQTFRGLVTFSNSIRKCYVETHRYVIVWRTVLEDARHPHMGRGAIDNEWGWMMVSTEPGRDPAQWCRVTFLNQVMAVPDHAPPCTAMDVIEDAIRRYRFCERPADPAQSFSCAPPNDEFEHADDAMKVFMGKGKRLELALSAAINNIIQKRRGCDA
ncbi:Aste57867_19618 [Aphanomyces stellatus]|uniref:Aste57867_19618 protein n=1 Tax=Aphanomyces stellatus TaxID=120398 RepID=A0A485LE79_9STRA|nr:hypothetical protein As57867_019554 [Aphanomyces stellatus]VFT96318.1 Aste57867_19618 [Aphanomyces stellatus]